MLVWSKNRRRIRVNLCEYHTTNIDGNYRPVKANYFLICFIMITYSGAQIDRIFNGIKK